MIPLFGTYRGKEKALEDLTTAFNAKQETLLRQAVHADPELVNTAATRITSYIVRQRLQEHDTPLDAYQKGGIVTAEINAILAEEICKDLITLLKRNYQDEKQRILAE